MLNLKLIYFTNSYSNRVILIVIVIVIVERNVAPNGHGYTYVL